MRKGRYSLAVALLLLLGVTVANKEELGLKVVTGIHAPVDEASVDEMPRLKIVTGARQLQVAENPVFDFKYEYQMDVNPSGSVSTLEQGINELQTTLLDQLNEFISQASTRPLNIQGISSEELVDTPCTPTTEGYSCGVVESTVTVEILNALGGDVVEKATIERIQLFIDNFNNNKQESVFVTFLGPFFVSTELVLEISPVVDEMDDTEIALLEGELFEILDPLLAGDPSPSIALETVEFLFQDLVPVTVNRRGLQGQPAFRNYAHLYVTGRCRGCTSGDLSRKVDDAVDVNADKIRETLQEEGVENGTNYFDGVSSVVVAAASGGSQGELSPDSDPGVNSDSDPYWIWVILGTAIGMLVLAFGLMYYKKRRDRIALDGKCIHEDGDVINRGVVLGMSSHDAPNDVYHTGGKMYEEEEAEAMPPVTAYVEESTNHDLEDGSYVCEADDIEQVYLSP